MPDPGSHAHDVPAAPGGLVLRSPAFADHAPIPARYGLDGGNESPPLEWSAPPAGTVELALLCEDPDAPSGRFTHWVVAGIPPTVTGLGRGLPAGATAGRNDFGRPGWGGPRPPVGDEPHRYVFRLFAVDRPLRLGPHTTGDELRAAVGGHHLATGTLVGLFAR